MKVERLVIDSNVWIVALVSLTGTARQLVDAVLDRDIDVLMSEATFSELASRLNRTKFDRAIGPYHSTLPNGMITLTFAEPYQ